MTVMCDDTTRTISETFRGAMDYFANSPHTGKMLERLARQRPRTMACMHGSAWCGDGANLLHGLRHALAAGRGTALTAEQNQEVPASRY